MNIEKENEIEGGAEEMQQALHLRAIQLRKEFDRNTIELAKTAIEAMVNTVVINATVYELAHEDRICPGKVISVVIELLKAIDAAANQATDRITANDKN
jgi:hypothetical protein